MPQAAKTKTTARAVQIYDRSSTTTTDAKTKPTARAVQDLLQVFYYYYRCQKQNLQRQLCRSAVDLLLPLLTPKEKPTARAEQDPLQIFY